MSKESPIFEFQTRFVHLNDIEDYFYAFEIILDSSITPPRLDNLITILTANFDKESDIIPIQKCFNRYFLHIFDTGDRLKGLKNKEKLIVKVKFDVNIHNEIMCFLI